MSIDTAAAAKAAEDKSPEAVRMKRDIEPHLILMLRLWLEQQGFKPENFTNEQILEAIRRAATTWTVASALDERSLKLNI